MLVWLSIVILTALQTIMSFIDLIHLIKECKYYLHSHFSLAFHYYVFQPNFLILGCLVSFAKVISTFTSKKLYEIEKKQGIEPWSCASNTLMLYNFALTAYFHNNSFLLIQLY